MQNCDFDKDAALTSIIYIASKVASPTFHKISKLLYFADKRHLDAYGRFISGDNYVAMKHGPVPSVTYDILKAVRNCGHPAFNASMLEEFRDALEVKSNYQIVPKALPNLEFLSETDLECLEYAIETYGSMSFQELTNLSHDEAYEATGYNDYIDIEDIAKMSSDGDILLEHLRDPVPG
mgnify:CR=1 FL=1